MGRENGGREGRLEEGREEQVRCASHRPGSVEVSVTESEGERARKATG